MVFGSVALASSWEPFRWAIAAIAVACFCRTHLVANHHTLLDLINWTSLSGTNVKFSTVKARLRNKGILNADGSEKPSQHHIYVNDNLMADIPRHLPQALRLAAESIFTVISATML